MLPFEVMRTRRAASLTDTQTVTTGSNGTAPNLNRGWVTSGFGSISDGTSNLYGGATITNLYWAQQGGVGTDEIVFYLGAGGPFPNSGWTKMVIDGGATYLRSAAVYDGQTSYTSWRWKNLGLSAAAQPFGAAGSVHSVVFS